MAILLSYTARGDQAASNKAQVVDMNLLRKYRIGIQASNSAVSHLLCGFKGKAAACLTAHKRWYNSACDLIVQIYIVPDINHFPHLAGRDNTEMMEKFIARDSEIHRIQSA